LVWFAVNINSASGSDETGISGKTGLEKKLQDETPGVQILERFIQ